LPIRQYTVSQRRIHWWVAGLVACQYLGQNAMRAAMDRLDEQTTPALADFLITSGHSFFGLAVLALTGWRWRLRRQHPVPPGNGELTAVQATCARCWHLSLYLAVAFMALSGALAYYTDMAFAPRWHVVGKWILGILVTGHMLAGLAHWLVLRDRVLHGMLGKARHADTMRSSDRSAD